MDAKVNAMDSVAAANDLVMLGSALEVKSIRLSLRVYSTRFLCDFDMRFYPFDRQKCSVVIVPKGNSGHFIRLSGGDSTYLGPVDLTQYFVANFSSNAGSNGSTIIVDLVFGRRILSTTLTTYVPTLLICVVSFSTNYFKGHFFEAIVTVNLTSLLVLATLFIGVSNALPATAYVKMMDIWLIVCLGVPFVEVLLQVRGFCMQLIRGPSCPIATRSRPRTRSR